MLHSAAEQALVAETRHELSPGLHDPPNAGNPMVSTTFGIFHAGLDLGIY